MHGSNNIGYFYYTVQGFLQIVCQSEHHWTRSLDALVLVCPANDSFSELGQVMFNVYKLQFLCIMRMIIVYVVMQL